MANTSRFAGECCGGLSERAALAHAPVASKCRKSEGQDWVDSLRSEERLTTQKGWRGRVRLCDGGGANDTTSTAVSCYVGWHKPPIHEYMCEARRLLVNFSAGHWTQWSKRKPLQRRRRL